MKKRKFKDTLGDFMLIGFLITTVLAIMFLFIYSYDGIDGEEMKSLLIFGMFVVLFLAGFIFSLDRNR